MTAMQWVVPPRLAGRVHPDHTVTDVHFTMDNLTGFIASDGPWAETEHG
jgi:hypothetical protein